MTRVPSLETPKGRTRCIFPRSVCIYIDQIYIKLYSASSRFEHCSNHSLNICKCFFLNGRRLPFCMFKNDFLFISDKYHNFIFCDFFTNWLPVAILDVRDSLSIAFLGISDRYETSVFQINTKLFILIFTKWPPGAYFRRAIFTFDRISGQFRSICNFWKFLTKWLTSAVLDVRNSLLIEFLAISERYGI